MREFKQNEDGTWFALETDKPGCMTDSWATREEADAMLTEAERGWDEVVSNECAHCGGETDANGMYKGER